MIKESDSTPKVSEASGGYLIGLAQGQPSPEEQLAFLAKLQRIFEEGEFTATYKFALLVALTELAVERGGDDNRALPLQIRWIAEKFAELYWPQTIEYSTGAVGTIPALLTQNLGATARVVSVLTNLRRSSGASTIAAAKRSGQWDAAIREIAHTVRAQPLKYLQNVGGTTVPFLYQFAEEPGWIELRPGAAVDVSSRLRVEYLHRSLLMDRSRRRRAARRTSSVSIASMQGNLRSQVGRRRQGEQG